MQARAQILVLVLFGLHAPRALACELCDGPGSAFVSLQQHVETWPEVAFANGIATLRFDFTGLGNSDGDFANTNFSSNVDDLIAAARHLEEQLARARLGRGDVDDGEGLARVLKGGGLHGVHLRRVKEGWRRQSRRSAPLHGRGLFAPLGVRLRP